MSKGDKRTAKLDSFNKTLSGNSGQEQELTLISIDYRMISTGIFIRGEQKHSGGDTDFEQE